MSKKKLILNENTTRRFMKLASVKPMYVSNFLKEAEEDELEDPVGEEAPEEAGMEEDPALMDDAAMDEELPEDDMGMEEPEAEEGGEPGEDMVMDFLKNAVMPWAEEKGVSMELAGDEEAEDDMGEELPEDDMGMEDEMGMEEPPAEEGGDELAPEGGEPGEEPADDEMLANRYQENLVKEVTRRVAARLLRESKK